MDAVLGEAGTVEVAWGPNFGSNYVMLRYLHPAPLFTVDSGECFSSQRDGSREKIGAYQASADRGSSRQADAALLSLNSQHFAVPTRAQNDTVPPETRSG